MKALGPGVGKRVTGRVGDRGERITGQEKGLHNEFMVGAGLDGGETRMDGCGVGFGCSLEDVCCGCRISLGAVGDSLELWGDLAALFKLHNKINCFKSR